MNYFGIGFASSLLICVLLLSFGFFGVAFRATSSIILHLACFLTFKSSFFSLDFQLWGFWRKPLFLSF